MVIKYLKEYTKKIKKFLEQYIIIKKKYIQVISIQNKNIIKKELNMTRKKIFYMMETLKTENTMDLDGNFIKVEDIILEYLKIIIVSEKVKFMMKTII